MIQGPLDFLFLCVSIGFHPRFVYYLQLQRDGDWNNYTFYIIFRRNIFEKQSVGWAGIGMRLQVATRHDVLYLVVFNVFIIGIMWNIGRAG